MGVVAIAVTPVSRVCNRSSVVPRLWLIGVGTVCGVLFYFIYKYVGRGDFCRFEIETATFRRKCKTLVCIRVRTSNE